MLLGDFEDDYGNRYRITSREWVQGSANRYLVVRWNIAGRYLIARNDAGNPADAGLWTRIDWMELPMAPYTWAFCYSAWRAASAEEAERITIANRETPRTGCNGHPFSRMRPMRP